MDRTDRIRQKPYTVMDRGDRVADRHIFSRHKTLADHWLGFLFQAEVLLKIEADIALVTTQTNSVDHCLSGSSDVGSALSEYSCYFNNVF
ncbi:hypothetical protein [Nostoc foliaceum]|uniref:Uncharacterized protein n=2 Tax=Nostoc TaxID=1177 RepID=A0ABR8IK83_9NOSO|nr:hypothetical protein [Nostoc foliaceum]MBD2560714.1 hypothetical protein [Nostoc linckia FACHB-391]MBD2651221.1 hypothetical protein [Nostoc foliaceum FACHB-393]